MTATPRYFTGRVVREAEEADFEVASMDNEKKFGPVFERLGFAEAIDVVTSTGSDDGQRLTCVTGAPHSLQNLEFGGSSVPHDPHNSPAAVSRTATIPRCRPRQYRVTAGQRCPSYRGAISDTKY